MSIKYFVNEKKVSVKKLSELLMQSAEYPQAKVTCEETHELFPMKIKSKFGHILGTCEIPYTAIKYKFDFSYLKAPKKVRKHKDYSTLLPYQVCKVTEATKKETFEVGKGKPIDNISMSKGAFQKLQEMACEASVLVQVPYLDGNTRKLAKFGTVHFNKPYLEEEKAEECPEEYLETKVTRIVNGVKKEVFVKDLPLKEMLDEITSIEKAKYRDLLDKYRAAYDEFEKDLYIYLKENFGIPVYPINPAIHPEYMAEKKLYGDLPTPERRAKVAEMELDAHYYGIEVPQVYYMTKSYKAGKYVKNKNRNLPDKFLHKVKVNEPLRQYFVPGSRYEGNNSTTTLCEKDIAWSKVDEAYNAYIYLKETGELLPGFRRCAECGSVESETYMVFDGEKWLCGACAGIRITNFVEDSYDEDDYGDDVTVEDDVVMGSEDETVCYADDEDEEFDDEDDEYTDADDEYDGE